MERGQKENWIFLWENDVLVLGKGLSLIVCFAPFLEDHFNLVCRPVRSFVLRPQDPGQLLGGSSKQCDAPAASSESFSSHGPLSQGQRGPLPSLFFPRPPALGLKTSSGWWPAHLSPRGVAGGPPTSKPQPPVPVSPSTLVLASPSRAWKGRQGSK